VSQVQHQVNSSLASANSSVAKVSDYAQQISSLNSSYQASVGQVTAQYNDFISSPDVVAVKQLNQSLKSFVSLLLSVIGIGALATAGSFAWKMWIKRKELFQMQSLMNTYYLNFQDDDVIVWDGKGMRIWDSREHTPDQIVNVEELLSTPQRCPGHNPQISSNHRSFMACTGESLLGWIETTTR
jgi:hypothetical protein